jgi:uncharacterized protein
MDFLLDLTLTAFNQMLRTLGNNWIFLSASVIIAALLNVYMDAEKVSAFLKRHRKAGVAASTTAAVATPLCSCGTTAVLLGMLASTLPWAPIVAFMVASPLTSPQELVYSAGLFGWPFAMAFFLASILLGLAGGGAAAVLEKAGWLENQTRFEGKHPSQRREEAKCQPARIEPANLVLLQPAAYCAGEGSLPVLPLAASSVCESAPSRPGLAEAAKEMFLTGRRLLLMFAGFAFIGYFLNGLIPQHWVPALFGEGRLYSVLLAATLGLPFYINTEASLPLVRALMDSGMSQGAALAFLISGAGTSIGAVGGVLTIARWRIVGLVIGVLWAGALVCGYLYDLIVRLGVV